MGGLPPVLRHKLAWPGLAVRVAQELRTVFSVPKEDHHVEGPQVEDGHHDADHGAVLSKELVPDLATEFPDFREDLAGAPFIGDLGITIISHAKWRVPKLVGLISERYRNLGPNSFLR